jgi:hypothetical protein
VQPPGKPPRSEISCTFGELSHVPWMVRRFHQIKTFGLGAMMKRIVKKVFTREKPPIRSAANTARYSGEVLDLRPGEWVKVRSRAEIQNTLNPAQRFKGLYLMPEMWKFCGRTFRVFKRLDSMMIESTGRIVKIKNTVLLEGVHCDGGERPCDASCFHFWREIWLTRVKKTARGKPSLREV